VGLGRVKTIEALMVQCIFGHVASISRDFVDSNRALSNLHGKWFGFLHGLGQHRKCWWTGDLQKKIYLRSCTLIRISHFVESAQARSYLLTTHNRPYVLEFGRMKLNNRRAEHLTVAQSGSTA
jgi:hypothetical protein